jgi:hypothetical protein
MGLGPSAAWALGHKAIAPDALPLGPALLLRGLVPGARLRRRAVRQRGPGRRAPDAGVHGAHGVPAGRDDDRHRGRCVVLGTWTRRGRLRGRPSGEACGGASWRAAWRRPSRAGAGAAAGGHRSA